jgi:hypothetical protein
MQFQSESSTDAEMHHLQMLASQHARRTLAQATAHGDCSEPANVPTDDCDHWQWSCCIGCSYFHTDIS